MEDMEIKASGFKFFRLKTKKKEQILQVSCRVLEVKVACSRWGLSKIFPNDIEQTKNEGVNLKHAPGYESSIDSITNSDANLVGKHGKNKITVYLNVEEKCTEYVRSNN